MSSHVIFWPTPPPPPQVMTSFMNSPLMLTTRDGFLLCQITNFYKVNNFCLLFQELSNPIFQDFHPFAWGRVSVYNGYQVNLEYNYSYFFNIYSCHFFSYCYIYYVLLPLLLHVNLEGWRGGTSSLPGGWEAPLTALQGRSQFWESTTCWPAHFLLFIFSWPASLSKCTMVLMKRIFWSGIFESFRH